MRKDGIPYVQNPQPDFKPLDYTKMDIEELRTRYLKTCARSMGSVSACSKCASPCMYGKRAIQLLAGQVYSDPEVPLYAGKTLIERAKEENMKRRKELEAKKMETEKKPVKIEKKKRNYNKLDGWWEKSLESGDQIKWLMDTMGISKTQAKKKVYNYKWANGMLEKPEENIVKEEPVSEVKVEQKTENNSVVSTMEQKLNELMKKQEECKKKADEYMQEYRKLQEQTNTLCAAIELFAEEGKK